MQGLMSQVLTGCWRAQVASEYIGATREAKPERTKIVLLRYSQRFSSSRVCVKPWRWRMRRPDGPAPRHAICLCSGPCRRQIAGWCERLTHDLAEIRGRSPTSWHLAPCRGAHVGVVPCLHRGGAATHAPASADSLRPHVPAALPSVLARSPGVGRERCRRSPTTPMRSQLVSLLPHRRARAA